MRLLCIPNRCIVTEYGFPYQRESRRPDCCPLGTYSVPEHDNTRFLSRHRRNDRREIHPRLEGRLKRLGSLPARLPPNFASPPSSRVVARTTPRGPSAEGSLRGSRFFRWYGRRLQICPPCRRRFRFLRSSLGALSARALFLRLADNPRPVPRVLPCEGERVQ